MSVSMSKWSNSSHVIQCWRGGDRCIMFLTQMSGAVYPSISTSLLAADTRLLTARVCWKCSFGHRNTLHTP